MLDDEFVSINRIYHWLWNARKSDDGTFCVISARNKFLHRSRRVVCVVPVFLSPILLWRRKGWRRSLMQTDYYIRYCVFEWIWMINKSKYHVERRFSVRSFPRRLQTVIWRYKSDLIEYLWDRDLSIGELIKHKSQLNAYRKIVRLCLSII